MTQDPVSKIHPDLEMIVATDTKGAIGKNNQLPWHLPADLKHFRKTTLGHIVIMGRKTFESIGKPLPGRKNIIISGRDLTSELAEVIHQPEEVFRFAESGKKLFIIGGAAIYQYFLPMANKIHRTLVLTEVQDADVFFPLDILFRDFSLHHQKCFDADPQNPFPFCFQEWIRRK